MVEKRPEAPPAARKGLKQGEGAPPPQIDPEHGGGKRPVEEEDAFGGAERTHDRRVRSEKTKP